MHTNIAMTKPTFVRVLILSTRTNVLFSPGTVIPVPGTKYSAAPVPCSVQYLRSWYLQLFPYR